MPPQTPLCTPQPSTAPCNPPHPPPDATTFHNPLHSFVRLKADMLNRPDYSVEDIEWDRLCLRIVSDVNDTALSTLKYNLQRAVSASGKNPGNYRLRDAVEAVRPVTRSNDIIQMFFAAVTLIAMAMCFFSLMSSMLTNIYEQSKEIGVIRALGLGRVVVVRLYIWESFILVISASLMGLFIGILQ